MKHVLIVAFDFPPQGASSAIRAAKLCKYLPDFGWWPTVICPDAVTRYDPSLLGDIPAGVQVRRVKGSRLFSVGLPAQDATPVSGKSQPVAGPGLARRIRWLARDLLFPDPQVLWIPGLVAAIRHAIAEAHPDVLLSTAPPFSLHLAAGLVKCRQPELPWVADYRDFWSPSMRGLRRRLSVFLERRCLRLADAAVFVNPTQQWQALEAIGQTNYPHAHVITNGFDAEDFIRLRGRVRPECEYVQIVYAGSLQYDRMRTQFFPALYQVCDDSQIRSRLCVHILGNFANIYPDLVAQLTDWGVLQITPFVPQQAALEAIWDADILLIVEPDAPVYRANHSQKLFEYLASGHPILAVVPEGEIAHVIREQQAGVVIHPEDQDGIVRAIRQMVEQWTPESRRHEDGIEKNRCYERREIARQMAALLDMVSAG